MDPGYIKIALNLNNESFLIKKTEECIHLKIHFGLTTKTTTTHIIIL
jgi:hypothetical protein